MKKANTKTLQLKEQTIPVRPDEQIDTSDIPEITEWSGAVRGLFARPATRQIGIRLSAADLVTANRMAAAKGLPYQTYIKSLLHEALERTRQTAALKEPPCVPYITARSCVEHSSCPTLTLLAMVLFPKQNC